MLIEVPNKDKSLDGWENDAYLERLKMLNSEVFTRQVLAEIKMWKRNGNMKAVHEAESIGYCCSVEAKRMPEVKQPVVVM